MRPDGTDLRWKQIGVLDSLKDAQLPFFIEWLSTDHPSQGIGSNAEITEIEIAGDREQTSRWIGLEPQLAMSDIKIQWIDKDHNEGETGIIAVHISIGDYQIRLD